MKFLFTALMMTTVIFASGCEKRAQPEQAQAPAANAPTAAPAAKQKVMHNGVVLSSAQTDSYTYIEVEENGTKFWIATASVKVDNGTEIKFAEDIWMTDFESRSLGRTFDRVLFVSTLQLADGAAPAAVAPAPGAQQAAVNNAPTGDAGTLKIAAIHAKRTEIAGKSVLVSGKVKKITPMVMGLNWITIEDGTGADETATLVMTSKDFAPALGADIKVQGTVAIDKDLGYGYFYKVLLENTQVAE